MKITSLTLYTASLEKQKNFYQNVLGFELTTDSKTEFSVQIGTSELTFKMSETAHVYHYCFLIPSNKIQLALAWLESRLEVISVEGKKVIEPTSMWHADSIYFYDGAGNIAEFIARYDLKNDTEGDFTNSDILNVNEIGIPSKDIESVNQMLEDLVGSKFWTGNKTRFGTNGDENGVFLLVNNDEKKTWFPTELPTEQSPVEVVVEVNETETSLSFKQGA